MLTIDTSMKGSRSFPVDGLNPCRDHLSHPYQVYRKGGSIPSFELLMKLLRTYSVNIAEILTRTGYMTPEIKISGDTKYVPLLSWKQAGAGVEKATNEEGEYWQIMETNSSGTFALQVRCESMEPKFFDGDILIINTYPKAKYKDYVEVSNEEWEATFKQLKKYRKTRVFHPLNIKT